MRYAFQEWSRIDKKPLGLLDLAHDLKVKAEKRETISTFIPTATDRHRPEGLVTAYTDGSYDPTSRNTGYGAVFIAPRTLEEARERGGPKLRSTKYLPQVVVFDKGLPN